MGSGSEEGFIYLFIEGLLPYNHTGSPQGFSEGGDRSKTCIMVNTQRTMGTTQEQQRKINRNDSN